MGKKKWTGPNERKRHNKHKGNQKRPQKHNQKDAPKDRESFKKERNNTSNERSK